MESDRIMKKLMCFGLTRQEASLYLCLAKNGGLTGYEASKQTGISRSNAYNALAGLADKGAAYTEEGTAVRYHAVDVNEFCSNKIRALEEIREELNASMPKPKAEAEGYLTIAGDGHIQNKVKNMIEGARERVYLSMTKQYVRIFEKEIKQAVLHGKKIVILTDGPLDVSGAIIYRTKNKECQIGVIADSSNVLTGEFGKGEDGSCLYSGQPNFVQVFKDSMQNEIELIRLLKGES